MACATRRWCVFVFGVMGVYITDHLLFKKFGPAKVRRGGVIRLETLIELNLFNSSFSSLSYY